MRTEDVSTRLDKADRYLRTLEAEGWIKRPMISTVLDVMQEVRGLSPALGVPNFGPSDGGAILMWWRTPGNKYLQAEVFATGEVEVYYQDKNSGFSDLAEFSVGGHAGTEEVRALVGSFLGA